MYLLNICGKGRINEADLSIKDEQITNEFKESMNERMSDAKEFYDEVKELLLRRNLLEKVIEK